MRVAILNGAIPLWLAGDPDKSERVHSSVRDFRRNAEQLFDIVPLLRAANTKQFDRKNQTNTLTFSTTRLFDTVDDADIFQLDYEDNYPLTGIIMLESPVAGGGVLRRYMANSVMQIPEMEPTGLTLKLNYQIIGGAITVGIPE